MFCILSSRPMHLSVCPFHFKIFSVHLQVKYNEVRAHRVIQLSFKEKSMMEIKLMSGLDKEQLWQLRRIVVIKCKILLCSFCFIQIGCTDMANRVTNGVNTLRNKNEPRRVSCCYRGLLPYVSHRSRLEWLDSQATTYQRKLCSEWTVVSGSACGGSPLIRLDMGASQTRTEDVFQELSDKTGCK